MRFLPASFLVLTALSAACSSSNTTDAGGDVATDAAQHADAASDASTADGSATDAASDASTSDAAPADATPADAAGDDAASGDDGGASCSYPNQLPMLAQCNGQWADVVQWVADGGPSAACPSYFTSGTQRADTLDALVSQLGCAGACTYFAHAAVSFLHCGHRDEYTEFDPTDASSTTCTNELQFSDGMIYASIAAYNAANPCP